MISSSSFHLRQEAPNILMFTYLRSLFFVIEVNIFKVAKLQDLVACSQVCKYLSFVASEETLWRNL